MNVNQCDCCGKIVKVADSIFLINKTTRHNGIGDIIFKKDICKECYRKITDMFTNVKG